jgi:hypothetical protein
LRGWFPKRHLPIQLGQYEVNAIIRCEDGRWELVAMAINEDEARAEGERRLAAGEPWMPEMRGRFNEPGQVLLSADTAEALAAELERADYPFLLDD